MKAQFRSAHAGTLTAFTELKLSRGYTYGTQIGLLLRFDRYLSDCGYKSALLTHDILSEYEKTLFHCKAYSQSMMLSVVRVYSRFLNMREPESCVLAPPAGAKHPSRFFLYTENQITGMMRAAGNLGPSGSIRPHTVKTLIGLLYVSGLRVGEALSLNNGDLDTRERVLWVKDGKFDKNRLVPLAESSVSVLADYRRKTGLSGAQDPLFINTRGNRLNHKTLDHTFKVLLVSCGIASEKPWPRLHDLRHTFAVNCVCRWYDEGRDVNALLPVLNTVMGHVKPSCTQIYLHTPACLRDIASDLFHDHAQKTLNTENQS